ncbi:epidermal growth factor receptor substrate 15-like 1 isoform X2 [Xenopus laevis]|uniref:Epidermal growth factor receptor substrate 15-like 1 isoform X2 n=1 Tax=Xenopus laevis TaxID=8355 RepID=A0A8J0UZY7_XENLA|nr:epidermal growth factor receptor substrate 15-like 1 isoform X2 [Xenopus laevis]
MAALIPLTQLSGGNPLYETYYKQVDPSYTGRVGPAEAALFLKKSALSDIILGKIWDLADPEGKGYLDKQGFYVALRLVACAQCGHEVSLASLHFPVPAPKFHDTSSPLLITPPPVEAHWGVRIEEKSKFDGIFDSLLPVNGLLSGDKVKPVLMNSKLPLDVLGRVWELSDIDKDGHLDRDEFAVAMHLVYRALEKEPVPSVLPPSLIPPNKRKKTPTFPGAVSVLPSSPPPKDSLRSTPSHGSMSSLNSAGSISPKHSSKPAQPAVNWVVPPTDKMRFDDIFLQIDLDMDGFVSGLEVKDIFMQSGLSQNILAHIWALADIRQTGKLNKDQFALAMYLIQQKVSKGIDPPQVLSPDMIPPSERSTPIQTLSGYMTPIGNEMASLTDMRRDSSSSVGSGEFTGVKELDEISQEIAQLQREKYALEQDIREKEEAIRHKSTEVQEMQNDLDRETSTLQELETQKQDAQDRLDEMDQQKAKLKDMLNDVRQKCQEEGQMISSLKIQIQSQESDVKAQEEELNRAKSELNRLQQEETQLEQSIQAGRVQLETIIKSLKSTQEEINQARSRLSQLQESQQEVNKNSDEYNDALNGDHGNSMNNLSDTESISSRKRADHSTTTEDPFKNKAHMFSNNNQDIYSDPFQTEDPFTADPFKGADPFKSNPFGDDPFKENDPFHAPTSEDPFQKPAKGDPFSADPFTKNNIHSMTLPLKSDPFESSDPFISSTLPKKKTDPFGTLDPFGSSAFSSNESFADFSHMSKHQAPDPFAATFPGTGFSEDPFKSKHDTPALPPKRSVPPRPKPPSGKSTPVSQLSTSHLQKSHDPFQPFGTEPGDPFQSRKSFTDPFSGKDPFATSQSGKHSKGTSSGFANFGSFGNEEQQLAWAKRESQRAEKERLDRLKRQEQEDLELAIALSKAEMPSS